MHSLNKYLLQLAACSRTNLSELETLELRILKITRQMFCIFGSYTGNLTSILFFITQFQPF